MSQAARLQAARQRRQANIVGAVAQGNRTPILNGETVRKAADSLADYFRLSIGLYKNIFYFGIGGNTWTSSVTKIKQALPLSLKDKLHPGWGVVNNWNRLSRAVTKYESANDDIASYLNRAEQKRTLSQLASAARIMNTDRRVLDQRVIAAADKLATSYKQNAVNKYNSYQTLWGSATPEMQIAAKKRAINRAKKGEKDNLRNLFGVIVGSGQGGAGGGGFQEEVQPQ
jgi:hypothetical protein